MILSAIIILATATVTKAFFEDFEDGDYTQNPTWQLTGTYHWHEIVESPTDSSNKVIRIHGTEEGASRLLSNIDENITIRNFRFSYDFYVDQYDFYPKHVLETTNSNIVLGLTSDFDIEGNIWFSTFINYPDWGTHSTYPSSILELSTWHKYVSYYDEINNGIVHELYNIDTGNLVANVFHSLADVTIDINNNISAIYFGCEETTWQYFDNISIVPEPTMFLLFGLGAVMMRRGKK
jgi:hypothetical protein